MTYFKHLLRLLFLFIVAVGCAAKNAPLPTLNAQQLAPQPTPTLAFGNATVPASRGGHLLRQQPLQGIQFLYNEALWGAVTAQTVAAQTDTTGLLPPHATYIKITFATTAESTAATTSLSYQQPQILIFPLAEQRQLASATHGAALFAALTPYLTTELTPVLDPLPLYPLLPGTEIFHSQVAQLAMGNGNGLRFITQYDSQPRAIGNGRLTYTYQAITADNAYYIAAFFPLDAPALDAPITVAELQDATAWNSYRQQTSAWLDQQRGSSFQPAMNQLDAIVTSLTVTPPSWPPPAGRPATELAGVKFTPPANLNITSITGEPLPAQILGIDDSDPILLEGVPPYLHFTMQVDDPWGRPATLTVQPIRPRPGQFYDAIRDWERAAILTLEEHLLNTTMPADIAHGRPLTFDNGHGLRVIKAKEQSLATTASLEPEQIYYHFEGVTYNGRYYLTFDYPLQTTTTNDLATLDDQQVTPTLAILDQFATSISIPDETAANVITLYATQTETEATPLPLFTCDNLSYFLADLTIPDGTQLTANTPFTKSWQLQNRGTCQWDETYQLLPLENTTAFSAATPLSIGPVAPGETLTLTVALITPATPGHYQASWQFVTAQQEPIGLPLTVAIEVPAPTPAFQPTVAATYGRLSGYIYYPNGVYTDLEIYIVNVDTGFYHAYTTQADWGSFWQEVDPGTYVIFGRVVGDQSGAAVAYTNAVACGLTANCTDHRLRAVTVPAGGAFSGLNLSDWNVSAATLPWP